MKSKKIYIYFGIFILVTFIIIYILSFIQPDVYSLNWWHRLLVTFRFILVNEHDRLNWVGLSAIGVMLSYVINSKFNRDKLRADLVSQSRMKWLDNVKEITTTFIKDVNLFNAKYIIFLNKVFIYNEDKEQLRKSQEDYYLKLKRKEETHQLEIRNIEILEERFNVIDKECGKLSDELNDILYRLIKNCLLIEMNFGKENEDVEIIKLCKEITKELSCFVVKTSNIQSEPNVSKLAIESESRSEKHEDKLEKLASILKDYYKTEWEKVKKGN